MGEVEGQHDAGGRRARRESVGQDGIAGRCELWLEAERVEGGLLYLCSLKM